MVPDICRPVTVWANVAKTTIFLTDIADVPVVNRLYGEVAVTSTGKTIATWGEGFSYTGPGGTWFNIQL